MHDGMGDIYMNIIKAGNLGVRFLLELCMLAALGYWGFHTARSLIGKIGLGIGIPLGVAVVWGVFLAPASSMRLEGPLYLVLEVVIFGTTAAALYTTDHPSLAGAFVLIAVLNKVLMVIWGQ